MSLQQSQLHGVAAGQKVDDTKKKEPADSTFLQGLNSIQEWASQLEDALRSQGNKIDQRKAKEQLLPKVIVIQKNLSALEDINSSIVQDAGTSIESVNREKMSHDLNALHHKLGELKKSFSALREGVQVISIPDITNIERDGETSLNSRDLQVLKSLDMLRVLGYGDDGDVDYSALKAHSEKITSLLHQAQDAFAKLHRYLET